MERIPHSWIGSDVRIEFRENKPNSSSSTLDTRRGQLYDVNEYGVALSEVIDPETTAVRFYPWSVLRRIELVK